MANSKVLTIFAGANGVGKSTLYYVLEEDLGIRLNTDELVQKSGKNWQDIGAQLNAARELNLTQNNCLENGISFNRETTVPGRGLEKLISEAKNKQFKIHLYYVNVESVDICKARVKNRVEKGGHGIPENVIEDRYRIMNSKIAELLPKCDKAQFYDNSFDSIQLVGYKEKDTIIKIIDNCKWLNELESLYDMKKTSFLIDDNFDYLYR